MSSGYSSCWNLGIFQPGSCNTSCRTSTVRSCIWIGPSPCRRRCHRWPTFCPEGDRTHSHSDNRRSASRRRFCGSCCCRIHRPTTNHPSPTRTHFVPKTTLRGTCIDRRSTLGCSRIRRGKYEYCGPVYWNWCGRLSCPGRRHLKLWRRPDRRCYYWHIFHNIFRRCQGRDFSRSAALWSTAAFQQMLAQQPHLPLQCDRHHDFQPWPIQAVSRQRTEPAA